MSSVLMKKEEEKRLRLRHTGSMPGDDGVSTEVMLQAKKCLRFLEARKAWTRSS